MGVLDIYGFEIFEVSSIRLMFKNLRSDNSNGKVIEFEKVKRKQTKRSSKHLTFFSSVKPHSYKYVLLCRYV